MSPVFYLTFDILTSFHIKLLDILHDAIDKETGICSAASDFEEALEWLRERNIVCFDF